MEDLSAFWFQKKLDLIIETQRELENVMEALDVALKHPLSGLSFLNEMIEGGCSQIFSSLYEQSKKRPLNTGGNKALAEIAREFYLRDEKAVSEFLDDVSEPSFNFSERRTNFVVETAVVREVFSQIGKSGDGRLDLVIMKWFFHAGKMIERLMQEGKARSDAQSKRGAKVSGKHVGHQAVWDAFYRVDWKSLKSVVKIGGEIESYLLEIQSKKPESKRKKIYCGDYIGKDILPKDPEIKKILLREGVLKS